MKETQASIALWAEETFGRPQTIHRIATRANQEMAELLTATSSPGWTKAEIVEEAADVLIILLRLAEVSGLDLLEAVDRKMAVNRARRWHLDGSGHGYHVKDDAA